jgi:hypothetical protein
MFPMNADPAWRGVLRGGEAGRFEGLSSPGGPTFVYGRRSRTLGRIGLYVLHEVQTYTSFQTPGQHSLPGVHGHRSTTSKSPQYLVGTPDDVLGLQVCPPKPAQCSILAGGGARARLGGPLKAFAENVLPSLR